MEAILWDWAALGLRWLHVIAGVAWIGSSFYFIHLDLSLRQQPGLPADAGGEAWQVHGGGFYHMVKYLVAPSRMPDKLTWFMWEAYTTWLSGMGLMAIVYYWAASLYLIDGAVLALAPWAAVAISVGGLAAGWVIYDLLCRSPLGRNDVGLAAAGFAALVGLAYAFTLVFSGRGAFMQMGALIGTMMVANVFLVIIPNQRKVVADLVAGRTPDPALGRVAKQRSLHNNYLTLPVIFVMIGTHTPLAFASRWNWLMLAIVLVVGAVIRHFFNQRHKGEPSPWWTWGVAIAGMLAVIWLSAQTPATTIIIEEETEEDLAAVGEIIETRCSMCHAVEPMWAGIASAPKGVLLETQMQIRSQARAIGLQAVLTHAMPPGNITGVEPAERQVLATWIAAGAPAW
jgi:uncharacterized membrane protein